MALLVYDVVLPRSNCTELEVSAGFSCLGCDGDQQNEAGSFKNNNLTLVGVVCRFAMLYFDLI